MPVPRRMVEVPAAVYQARSLARRVSIYNALNQPGLVQYSIAAKVFATNTAFEAASAALRSLGRMGTMNRYPRSPANIKSASMTREIHGGVRDSATRTSENRHQKPTQPGRPLK